MESCGYPEVVRRDGIALRHPGWYLHLYQRVGIVFAIPIAKRFYVTSDDAAETFVRHCITNSMLHEIHPTLANINTTKPSHLVNGGPS